MEGTAQLKIQSFLDGELPRRESAEISALLYSDPEAKVIAAELRTIKEALRDHEADVKLPESREFFWSKVERGIRAQERPSRRAFRWAWLVPATAAALTLLVTLPSRKDTSAYSVELLQAPVSTFTYHDFEAGTTLVWLNFPAEEETREPNES